MPIKIFIVLSVIIAAQIIQLYQVKYISANIDEIKYITAARNLIKNPDWSDVYERLHPPMMYYLANIYSNYATVGDVNSQLFWARFPIILLFPFFALAVFFIAMSIYGFLAALLALTLFLFNPEILAHSRFITPDFISSFGFLLSVFSFSYFISTRTLKAAIILGICLGFTLLTKYTALVLFPFILVYILFVTKKEEFMKVSGSLAISFAISIFILNAAYLFHGSLQIPNYFESSILSLLSNSPLRLVLYLFPKPFLMGLDLQFKTSSGGWWGWFWGQQYIKAPWYVFPATFIIKTPLPLLILILFVFIFGLRKGFIRSKTETVFLFFTIIFTWYMSFVNHIAIGLRYLLPIYPFIFILASKIVIYRPKSVVRHRTFDFVLIFLICWYVIKTVTIAPHFLEYVNEGFGGPNNAYKYFVDSSLDWGQNNLFLQSYIASHPDVKVEPQIPETGIIIVDVNNYNLWKYGNFEWLRRLDKKPVGNIGYTWLIFNLTQKDMEKL